MKKLLILFIIFILFLSGCGILNLDGWFVPDDAEFLNCIQELDTPKKICQYMLDNFTYKVTTFYNLTPYELWQIKEGDCNDFCTFARFIAEYHNYETYYILIYYKDLPISHVLGVFLEDGKYTYSNNRFYHPLFASSFSEIVSNFFNFNCEHELKSYKVYDNNSIIYPLSNLVS